MYFSFWRFGRCLTQAQFKMVCRLGFCWIIFKTDSQLERKSCKMIISPLPSSHSRHMTVLHILHMYWGLNQTTFCRQHMQMHYFHENICILIEIELIFALKGGIDNKSSLVQVMVQCQTGDKPLHKLMITKLLKCFYGGSLLSPNLLRALENSHGGWPRPSKKKNKNK